MEDSENYNPYDILGIPNGSSTELIKATYKSLVKIFHPDVFKGDKQFAVDRVAELNKAYEYLSDPAKKTKLDQKLSSQNNEDRSGSYNPEDGNDEFSRASDILKEKWELACEYHPELVALHQSIKLLDSNSAAVFVFIMVEEKLFTKAREIADELETRFFASKFGTDREICALAKLAILSRETQFAKQLNQALKVLGEGSKENIFLKLLRDHPEFAKLAFEKIGRKDLLKYINTEAPEPIYHNWEKKFDRATETGSVASMKAELEKFNYKIVEAVNNKSGKVFRPKINASADTVQHSYKSNFELMRIMNIEKKIIREHIVKA